MATYDYDLFTIGAGSGGVRAARLAGALGKRSAIAEDWTVGGTCVHRGCIPKKFYVYASHFGEEIEDARAFGWDVEVRGFDWPRLVAAKKKELARLEGLYVQNLAGAGVRILRGRAVLEDAHTINVAGERVTAENILIATGGRPYMHEIPGHELMITSDQIFDLPEFPKRVAIAGAGYIALEFAGILNGLGAEVTVVYRRTGVLRGFDDDVRTAVQEELEAKGITFVFETVFERIDKKPDGLHVRLRNGDTLVADQVLMAAGRDPSTRGLGCDAAGVALNARGAVVVDEYSRTTKPNICAIGDVTERVNLTPVAIHEAMCLIDTLFHDTRTKPDHADVATAVFTQPPVGVVGLTEGEARERFGNVDIYRARFRPLKHTISGRPERVLVKLVVDHASDRVVGAHMVGLDAPEIIQALAVAVKARVTKAQFDATMAVHPTTAEELVLMYQKTTN
ncbi:MAG: glutathione-disulfide reductase [Alphaproteobacteria bacterium]|nr:glutathione-disulfide reductase [Alphaproteobacteria bacterium]